MDDIKAKQQVIEKIKASANILVTVSNDPSVDALSAALGLALVLDKAEKYSTAIFSGTIPTAMEFLEPEKTFEDTTDSLRDFIIALNKEKADHLRYKVEGDVVRIFITPYKTTITKDDLEFTQGDVNVELVIALGVSSQDQLDAALENHGQILHDAAVVTMTVGDQTSTLGGIDWHDPQSSSLSEMVVGLAEALKESKDKPLIDAPIATALLTGIVAETNRFSNAHTTAKVMTVSAELMAAGADQQLIAFKLEESNEIGDSASSPITSNKTDAGKPSETLSITHEGETLAELEERVKDKAKPKAVVQAETPKIINAYALDNESPTPQAPEEDAGREYIAGAPSSAYALDEHEETAPLSDPADNPSNNPAGFPGTPETAPGSVSVNGTLPATPELLPTLMPTPTPADLGLPLPPPLPDFSAPVVPVPALPITPSQTPPERLGDILAPDTPPMAQSASLPPSDTLMDTVTPPVSPTPAINPADPGQFKIPGQL